MNKPWFGRKLLGWGWGLPQTWQGWMLLLLYIVTVVYTVQYFAFLIFASIIFFVIIWKTSGKPQWGTLWRKKKH